MGAARALLQLAQLGHALLGRAVDELLAQGLGRVHRGHLFGCLATLGSKVQAALPELGPQSLQLALHVLRTRTDDDVARDGRALPQGLGQGPIITILSVFILVLYGSSMTIQWRAVAVLVHIRMIIWKLFLFR